MQPRQPRPAASTPRDEPSGRAFGGTRCSAARWERAPGPTPTPRRAGAVAAAVAVLSLTAPAFAQPARPRSPADVPFLGVYTHMMASASIGDSLRFNNPFRLANQLGSTGESLSRTPVYANLAGAVAWGNPDGWQHGASLQWARALAGLPQHVVTPSYVLVQGGWRPWLAWGRAGLPIILNPDWGVGGEAAVGGAWLMTAGLGLQAELVGNVFYGAATWDKGVTTIPMLSLQVGVLADHEVLP